MQNLETGVFKGERDRVTCDWTNRSKSSWFKNRKKVKQNIKALLSLSLPPPPPPFSTKFYRYSVETGLSTHDHQTLVLSYTLRLIYRRQLSYKPASLWRVVGIRSTRRKPTQVTRRTYKLRTVNTRSQDRTQVFGVISQQLHRCAAPIWMKDKQSHPSPAERVEWEHGSQQANGFVKQAATHSIILHVSCIQCKSRDNRLSSRR